MEIQLASNSLVKADKKRVCFVEMNTMPDSPSHNVYQQLQWNKRSSEVVYEDIKPGVEYAKLDPMRNAHTKQLSTLHQSLELNRGHNDTICQGETITQNEKEPVTIHVVAQRMKLILLVMMIVNFVILLFITIIAILGNIRGLSSLIQPVNNQTVSMQLNSTYSAISELTASIQSLSLHLDTTDDNITSALNQLSTTQYRLSRLITELDAANSNISSVLSWVVNLQMHVASIQTQVSDLHPCGPGEWHRVAYLNMRDPTQQCPSAWREYNTGGVRACWRPSTSGGSSAATTYSIDFQYKKVCGRVVGYQFGSPDGFLSGNINKIYVDGISITHGSPRQHVWTYAAGLTETASINGMSNCPCSTSPGSRAPSFVGINYYCESGNPTDTFTSQLYTNDKLWDGKQCEGSCCTGADTPPWFKVHLSSMTSDDIEIRILGNEGTSTEDTPVELIEMFASQ